MSKPTVNRKSNEELRSEFIKTFDDIALHIRHGNVQGVLYENMIAYWLSIRSKEQAEHEKERQEKYQELIGKIKRMKLRRTIQSASEAVCQKCGFSNDHRECACVFNSTVDRCLALIQENL